MGVCRILRVKQHWWSGKLFQTFRHVSFRFGRSNSLRNKQSDDITEYLYIEQIKKISFMKRRK